MNRLTRVGAVVGSVIFLSSAAQAQLVADFEAPAFTGSAAGVAVVGQQGWYTPGVAGTIGQFVYTYAGNALGLSANPAGGAQFMGGRSDGGTALARAQHDFDFSTSTTWTLTFDYACNYDGVTPATPNLSSFSLNHPTLTTGFKQFIALCNFVDVNNPSAGWKIEYNISNSAGTALANQSAGPEWSNLTFNQWYRISTTVDFSTNQITDVSITDLTSNATFSADPDWYVTGGASSTLPLPPSIRCFVGGATAGSIGGFDNVSVTVPGCAADFNADTVVDFFDYLDFVAAFSANEPAADFNADTVIDFFDYLDFVAAFSAGC